MDRGHDGGRRLDRGWRWSCLPPGGRGASSWVPTSSAASWSLQLNLQAAGVRIPVEYLSMSALPDNHSGPGPDIFGQGRAGSLNAPGSLNRSFHASG